MEIKIANLRKMNHKKTRAFADLIVGELLIQNFRLVENADGNLFMSMPAEVKDGKWYSTVRMVDPESKFKETAEKILIDAYNE